MKKRKIQIRNRNGVWIIVVATVVLELTACIQYFYSSHGIREEASNRATSELKRAELEIDIITNQLEAAVTAMAFMAQHYLDNPDTMAYIAKIIVENTPNMEGAAIAFVDNYYPSYGKWYEVYAHKLEYGEGAQVETKQIGSETHDYLQSEWFNNGLTIDSCWWCEPYFDNAGANAMLVSCSYPIRDKSGKVVAVALADLSLRHLQRISEYLQIYPESYYSITSGNGTHLVPEPDTLSGRKYHIFTEDIDATGWKIAIIVPDDVIFRNLKKIGLLVTILMIVGVLILIFIVYKSIKDVQTLIELNGQKEKMQNELEVAKNVQFAMLPKMFPPYPDRQDLDMSGVVLPAKEVGGDLYDFYIRENKLFFIIGDVSGKGIPAALVMAVTRSLFRTLSAHDDTPSTIIEKMNEAMSEMSEQNMFVTAFLGALDLQTGDLLYCNAGHNAPYIIRNETKSVEQLTVNANLPLGILTGFAFQGQQIKLRQNDIVFLYTDGLSEAENENKELFAEQRIENNLALWDNAQETKHQLAQMEQAVKAFVGEAEQSDDLTMLIIKYIPDNQTPSSKVQTVKHTLVMRNDIQQIPTLAEWVEGLGVPPTLDMSINLALEEIVSNVMLYAYPEGQSGRVLIEAERSNSQIVFVVSDSGKPFDPTKQADADITLSAEERQIGGLGIYLVRQIMDEIHYQRIDNKNILTLIKKL